MNWAPIVLTLKLAGLTALILVAVGMPIAYWLTYSRWRWKFLAESVVALPLVLPPTVLGFYVLVAVGPKSPLGQGYQALVGHPWPLPSRGSSSRQSSTACRLPSSPSRLPSDLWIRSWLRPRGRSGYPDWPRSFG